LFAECEGESILKIGY